MRLEEEPNRVHQNNLFEKVPAFQHRSDAVSGVAVSSGTLPTVTLELTTATVELLGLLHAYDSTFTQPELPSVTLELTTATIIDTSHHRCRLPPTDS